MNYKDKYMMTAFIIHSKKNILTNKVTSGGSWAVRENLRKSSVYAFHTRLNCNLKASFKGKPFYTEKDIVGVEDAIVPVVALNSIVMRTLLDRSSTFALQLKSRKELVDYLANVSRTEIKPSLNEYIVQLALLSDGMIQVCIRIESLTDYMRDMFKEGITQHIELPGVNKRFALQDAITLVLSRDLDELPKKYQPYIEELKDIGFINHKEILEGIFDQQLFILEQDDCLPNFILTLGELAYLKELYVEDVLDALLYCKKEYNILSNLREFELKPLAEYFVNLCYETIKPKEDM